MHCGTASSGALQIAYTVGDVIMLVLSRRPNEKVVFPKLGVSLEILKVSGNTVRVGVIAPREIEIARGEIAENFDPARRSQSSESQAALSHRRRNQLNTAKLALHLMQRQLACGLHAEAEATLDTAIEEFSALEQGFTPRSRSAGSQAGAARQALVVEDDRNERALLAGLLRMRGFHVDEAADGRVALDYLESHEQPDVVLMDMGLPRLDGPATISAIRSNPARAGLLVFAVSGATPKEAHVAIGPSGVDRWFCKPIDLDILMSTIDREVPPALRGRVGFANTKLTDC
jgi:carbon storage regulator CsrA